MPGEQMDASIDEDGRLALELQAEVTAERANSRA